MNFKEFKKIIHAGKEKKIKEGGVMYRTQRNISAVISWVLIKTFPDILPNHITVGNTALLFCTVLLVSMESVNNLYLIVSLQLILLNFASILDKVDGEIARFKQYYTQKGIYYDLLFHFFYPIALYSSVGYFFYFLSGNMTALIVSFFAGIIMTVEVALRKSRHHIKYKIQLEKSQKLIRDYRASDFVSQSDSLIVRLINYSVLFIYDWVWIFYASLVLMSLVFDVLAVNLFIAHLVITVVIVLHKIVVVYPRAGLYTAESLRD